MAGKFALAVTENDYWVSFPLEGLTPRYLKLGVYQHTQYILNATAIANLLATANREAGKTCKYCTRRKPRRLFIVLKPLEDKRLIGFVVCETCADQFTAEVADPRYTDTTYQPLT